jgi:hypothetical protein
MTPILIMQSIFHPRDIVINLFMLFAHQICSQNMFLPFSSLVSRSRRPCHYTSVATIFSLLQFLLHSFCSIFLSYLGCLLVSCFHFFPFMVLRLQSIRFTPTYSFCCQFYFLRLAAFTFSLFYFTVVPALYQ